jgi:hypothetical protein
MKRQHIVILGGAILLGLLMVACGAAPGGSAGNEVATACPEAEACPACPEPICPEPESVAGGAPFEQEWAGSAHAAADTEPFRHWDEEDPAEVPTTCAKCHTSGGFRDFMGADGSAFGSVEQAQAPEQAGIVCQACHNNATINLSSVVMPSGIEITGLGGSAICMQCHQGRESLVSVNLRIAGADASALTEEDPLGYTLLEGIDQDAVNPELGFANVHYYPAAATLFGSETHGGYEFEGHAYQIRTSHVEQYNECIDCHNQHTLEVRVDECVACHVGVTEETLHDIRMNGSLADYDGDGNIEEGVYYEMQGLADILYTTMQDYAVNTTGTPIEYNADSYPYFFDDAGEAYSAWTPHLLQAAYNYQMFQKDPGAFAHNPKYHIALLYDSIEVLGGDVSGLTRNDPGHFDGTAEAFRHWDEEGEVPGGCARCHSGEGIPTLLKEGVNISAEPANGYQCTNCHAGLGGDWPRLEAESATFPSGTTVSFVDNPEANLCIQCHQGRESGLDVDAAIAEAGVGPDAVMEGQSFINIHYFPAGVSFFGSNVNGAYQYPGKTYAGQRVHVPAADSCVECHNVHALEVNLELCSACHGDGDPHTFRMRDGDFDGDGDDGEGAGQEVEGMIEALYAAIQAYAVGNPNTDPIVYDANRYPYFFNDAGESYATFTPRLLRAAYNYQYAQKDPGAFAHNPDYVMQILYDSIQDLGGSAAVSGMTRP